MIAEEQGGLLKTLIIHVKIKFALFLYTFVPMWEIFS